MSFLITSRELFDSTRFPIVATRIADRPLRQTDLHRHEFFEILFVTNGTLRNQLASQEVELRAGDLMVIKPYVQHLLSDWKVKDRERAYSCSFLPQAVDSSLQGIEEIQVTHSPNRYYFESMLALADEDVSAVHLQVPDELIPTIEAHFEQLVEASTQSTQAGSARARCGFLSLLTTLSEMNEGRNAPTPQAPRPLKLATSRHRAGLRKALDYIHSHLEEPISLEEAAEMSGVSVSYFSVLIKQFTGVSFINYLTSLRIDQACSMLRSSTDSILDICYKVGFNDYSNFSKRFKKVTGLSPRAYRARSRSEADD